MTSSPSPCRCGIEDWRGLRTALGMSLRQFAAFLGVSKQAVQMWERQGRHRCPQPLVRACLRSWLTRDDMKARLVQAKYPHPWPED